MKFSRKAMFLGVILVALAASFAIQSATPIATTAFAGVVFLGFPEERSKPLKHHAALELISGFTTTANVTFAGLGGGDFDTQGRFQVKSFTAGTKAWMLNCWSHFQSGLPKVRFTSQALHDSTSPILLRPISAQVYPLLSNGYPQVLTSQDFIRVEHQGSAVAGDIESTSILNYYNDSAYNCNLISEKELDALATGQLVTVEVPITAGVAGGYSGAALLNSGVYTLVNNRRYALLGGHCSIPQCAVGIRGTDFANFRLGFPGNAADKLATKDFFVQMSRDYGAYDENGNKQPLALIPTIGSGNAGNITIDVVNNENAASPVVTLLFIQLRG